MRSVLAAFLLACLLCALILFVPGYVAVRFWVRRLSVAIASAPLVSVLLYAVVGVALSALGIPAGAPVVLGVALAAALALCVAGALCRRGRGEPLVSSGEERSWWWLVAAAVGSLLFLFVYVRESAGVDTVIQSYDNVFHYEVVRALSDSTDWSLLHVSKYPAGSATALMVFDSSGGFYPIGWHIIAALVESISGVGVPVAANAANFSFVALVFPVGVCSLIETVFPGKRSLLIVGALSALSLGAFPWSLLCSWPLFPNLSSLCMAPAVIAAFIGMTRPEETPLGDRFACVALFLAGSCALAVTQPNTIFSCAVFLAPYCVFRVFQLARSRNSGRPGRAWWVAGAAAVAIAIIWMVVSSLPPLQGVVQYYWPPISSKWQAFVDFFLVAYPAQPAQLLAAALVACGAVRLLFSGGHRWLVFSYLLSGAVYVVAASFGDTYLKHLLSGFWYTDPYRTAATAALCALPILCVGILSLFDAILRLARRATGRHVRTLAALGSACVLALVNFGPSYEVRGVGERETAYGFLEDKAWGFTVMSDYATFSSEKRDFLARVRETVGDSLVVNQPYDGSLYAYSVSDLNTLYRDISGYGDEGETDTSVAVRSSLDEVATNPEVSEALDLMDAEYVLILERDVEHMELFYPTFEPERWQGLLSIDDSTPGFEVVLSEGDMRLYRIVE